jgi:hypothetical protein
MPGLGDQIDQRLPACEDPSECVSLGHDRLDNSQDRAVQPKIPEIERGSL